MRTEATGPPLKNAVAVRFAGTGDTFAGKCQDFGQRNKALSPHHERFLLA